LSRYLEELERTGKNLIVFNKGEIIFSSSRHGLTPLIEAIEAFIDSNHKDLITADQIVGKAAVLLNIHLGAEEVHAILISSSAKKLLQEKGIKYVFKEETEAIKEKDGVIFCPFERLVQGITDPEEAYTLIKAKLKEISKSA
jgi:hypothetical protein